MRRLEIAVLTVGALAVFGLLLTAKPQRSTSMVPSYRQVRLSSRTIHLDERGVPVAEPDSVSPVPKSSARGTRSVLVQFEGRANSTTRRLVESTGARILGVIPPHGFSVEADVATAAKLRKAAGVKAVFDCAVRDKIAAGVPLDSPAEQFLTVLPLAEADVDRLREQVVAAKGTVVEEPREPLRLRILLAGTSIAGLAANGEVAWIERYERPRPLNDVAVTPGLMNVTPVWNTHGLTGKGQFITTSDTGIDTGDLATMHVDFTNNLVGFKVVDGACGYDPVGHGTHTAGSLVGDGTATNGVVRGVAYEAKLWAWFCGTADGGFAFPDTPMDLFRPSELTAGRPYIHSASWGGDHNCYSTDSMGYDAYVWFNTDFLPVFSAGNGWRGAHNEWLHSATSICTQAASKNVLAVGASENLRPGLAHGDNPAQIAYFSSRGPLPDGRIKPDVVAPGTCICSTVSELDNGGIANGYQLKQGTSMACPLTAGAATLTRQWLVERRGFTNAPPTAALLKAVLMGGATDLYGQDGTNVGSPAPNSEEGWGRVNLEETLFPSNRQVRLIDHVPFRQGTTRTYDITLTEARPLDVQLVWIDYMASPQAELTLVNDLDLIVSNKTTGAVWYGNGIVGGDHTNNAESVRLTAEEAPAGAYSVSVRGTAVVYDCTEGGAAALYLRGALSDEPIDPEPVALYALRVYCRGYPFDEGYSLFYDPSSGEHFNGELSGEWFLPADSERTIDLPGDLAWGERLEHDRVYKDGVPYSLPTSYKLGSVSTARCDQVEAPVTDDKGRMPWSVKIRMDGDKNVIASYYDTNAVWTADGTDVSYSGSGIPCWWSSRYLSGGGHSTAAAADVDGDGFDNWAEYTQNTDPVDDASFTFRINDFSPPLMSFVGSIKGKLVVQRCDRLNGEWRGILTNASARASVTNTVNLADETKSNGFYRVIYENN